MFNTALGTGCRDFFQIWKIDKVHALLWVHFVFLRRCKNINLVKMQHMQLKSIVFSWQENKIQTNSQLHCVFIFNTLIKLLFKNFLALILQKDW